MFNLIRHDMQMIADPEKAKVLQGFFKTGKGEYGEGDIFLGITVPQSRIVARKYLHSKLADIQKLLRSRIHEHRLVGLLILADKFRKGDGKEKQRIAGFYLKSTSRVNNWDLVDMSADKILGEYLLDKRRGLLRKLAKSKSLWERRIAVVSTFAFIKRGQLKDTFAITEALMADKHDLIQKACGWMLREAGKKNCKEMEAFLRKHRKTMPRTMLRYAIERFSKKRKEFYMKK